MMNKNLKYIFYILITFILITTTTFIHAVEKGIDGGGGPGAMIKVYTMKSVFERKWNVEEKNKDNKKNDNKNIKKQRYHGEKLENTYYAKKKHIFLKNKKLYINLKDIYLDHIKILIDPNNQIKLTEKEIIDALIDRLSDLRDHKPLLEDKYWSYFNTENHYLTIDLSSYNKGLKIIKLVFKEEYNDVEIRFSKASK